MSMPSLLLVSSSLAKSFVQAHTKRFKDGRVVQVAAYFDKRVRKGTEHAPAHGHNLNRHDARPGRHGNRQGSRSR